MSSTLVFAYNADSGLFNVLTDMAHKILSPNTYPCRLCALTYGHLGMYGEWRDFVKGLNAQVEFLHAGELKGRYGVGAVPLPAMFIKSVAPKLGVVQDGVLRAKTAQVPVSKAFLEIAAGDARLGKRHTSSSLRTLLLLLKQIAMHWVVLRKPCMGHGLVADMPY